MNKYIIISFILVAAGVLAFVYPGFGGRVNMNITHIVMNGLFIATAVAGIVLCVVAFRRKKNIAFLTICMVFVLELVLAYGSYRVRRNFLPVNQVNMLGVSYEGSSKDTTENARFVPEKKTGSYRFRLPLGNLLLILAVWQLGWGRKKNNANIPKTQ